MNCRRRTNHKKRYFRSDPGTLSWVKVLNAGHLAARDQPKLIELIKKKSRAWKA